MRALLPPFPASEDAAAADEPVPGGVATSPFSLFAAGSNLPNKRCQALTAKDKSKAEFEHLLVDCRGIPQTPAKLEARKPLAGLSLGGPSCVGGRT